MLRNLTRPVEAWRGLSAIIDNNTLIFKSYTLEIVVQIFDTFANDLDIRSYFTKYLKESLLLISTFFQEIMKDEMNDQDLIYNSPLNSL